MEKKNNNFKRTVQSVVGAALLGGAVLTGAGCSNAMSPADLQNTPIEKLAENTEIAKVNIPTSQEFKQMIETKGTKEAEKFVRELRAGLLSQSRDITNACREKSNIPTDTALDSMLVKINNAEDDYRNAVNGNISFSYNSKYLTPAGHTGMIYQQAIRLYFRDSGFDTDGLDKVTKDFFTTLNIDDCDKPESFINIKDILVDATRWDKMGDCIDALVAKMEKENLEELLIRYKTTHPAEPERTM
jgi:hypothetical protein